MSKSQYIIIIVRSDLYNFLSWHDNINLSYANAFEDKLDIMMEQ